HRQPSHRSRDLRIPGYLDTSLLHWDGRAWTSVEDRHVSEDDYGHLPPSAQQPAPPPDRDKIVGRDELADSWTHHGGGRRMPPFKAGYRTGGSEIWATDDDGRQLAHFDGRTWTVGGRLAS